MVYILLGKGFEDIEAIAPCDILRRGGVEVQFAGIGGKEITGSNGVVVKAECTVEEIDLRKAEMIVVPGGMGGVESILGCETALNILRAAFDGGLYVAAICAGPMVLSRLGILDGKKATCYPGLEAELFTALPEDEAAVTDGKVITGRGPGAALDFGYALLTALKGQEVSDKVRSDMVYTR